MGGGGTLGKEYPIPCDFDNKIFTLDLAPVSDSMGVETNESPIWSVSPSQLVMIHNLSDINNY